MNKYVGMKVVEAAEMINPLSKADGYQIMHPDGNESWSPKEQFEDAFVLTTGMPFGLAIEYMKKGYKVARKGWNGKGMWLVLQNTTPDITPHKGSCYSMALEGIQETITIDAHIDMYTAGGTMQPGWLASQADILAEDYYIVEELSQPAPIVEGVQ